MNAQCLSRWWVVALFAGGVGCASPPADAESSLGPIESALDPAVHAVWPGAEGADGVRRVPRHAGFFRGRRVGYWYGGPATRATADVFWFCREGESACPLDEQGVLAPQSAVGDPVFARIPGEHGYSPYWRTWVVTVPDDYQPNAIKSVFGIEQAVSAGEVEVSAYVFDFGGAVGPAPALMNCLLVLAGTELAHSGDQLVDGSGERSRVVSRRLGWFRRYEVHYFDFTEGEGVLPPDPSSESVGQMPASDLYRLQRDCAGGSLSPVCSTSLVPLGPVSEPELGVDLDGDGDLDDTNDVLSGMPGEPSDDPNDLPYTALWRVMGAPVAASHDADVKLIDSPGGSAVADTGTLRALVELGHVAPPTPLEPPPGSLSATEVLFNGAVQLPE